MRNIAYKLLIGMLILLSSCAQVPKEAVTLSATVGRDMAEMHRAHRALAVLLYDRMVSDVNNFIDDVYAPYQIQKTLEELQKPITDAIKAASKPDPTGEAQKTVIEYLSIYLEEVRNEVETYRKVKLEPIEKQRDALIKEIDDSYGKIHYANSIVTGHLGSVVNVHETQNELLAKVDFKDLRMKVGTNLTDFSEKMSKFVEKAKESEDKVEKLSTDLEKLIEKFTKSK